jgi:hypothetical protein
LELINFEVFKENLNSEGQQFPQYVKKRTITSHVNSLTNKHKPGPLKPDEHFQSINSFGVEIKENLHNYDRTSPPNESKLGLLPFMSPFSNPLASSDRL